MRIPRQNFDDYIDKCRIKPGELVHLNDYPGWSRPTRGAPHPARIYPIAVSDPATRLRLRPRRRRPASR